MTLAYAIFFQIKFLHQCETSTVFVFAQLMWQRCFPHEHHLAKSQIQLAWSQLFMQSKTCFSFTVSEWQLCWENVNCYNRIPIVYCSSEKFSGTLVMHIRTHHTPNRFIIVHLKWTQGQLYDHSLTAKATAWSLMVRKSSCRRARIVKFYQLPILNFK